MDSAPVSGVQEIMTNVAATNPGATLIQARSTVRVDDPDLIRGKRVLLIEDGPTLTHGEMAYGSGGVAAHRYGAAEVVDPKPFARGSLIETFARFPWVQRALPAMGYSQAQLEDLAATIAAVECDSVVIATPVDLARLIPIAKPYCRVHYDLEEISHPDLTHVVCEFLRAQSDRLPSH
jgi:predicted GTPase